MADGEFRNNFLKRAVTWNPNGVLNGARHIQLAGPIAYITADVGLVVVDLSDPLHPRLAAVRSEEHTSELQSLMRISYAVFCLKQKNRINNTTVPIQHQAHE